MTEGVDQPAKPLRTWRPMVLWSAGILLVLGLVWLLGSVVVYAFQVRRELSSRIGTSRWQIELGVHPILGEKESGGRAVIERLGGPDAAARKLRLFRKLPDWFTERGGQPDDLTRKESSYGLLRYCGPAGIADLAAALQDKRASVRFLAANALAQCGPEAKVAIPALEEVVKRENDEWTRSTAADALKNIRAEEPPR